MDRDLSAGAAATGTGAASRRRGSGLASHHAAALSYLFGPFTGALFLWLDEEDPHVRFHALQSVALTAAWVVVWLAALMVAAVLSVIPLLGGTLSVFVRFVVAVTGFALWAVALWRAWRGDPWELPLLGPLVRRLEAMVAEDLVGEEMVAERVRREE